jgi:hypothetical protein
LARLPLGLPTGPRREEHGWALSRPRPRATVCGCFGRSTPPRPTDKGGVRTDPNRAAHGAGLEAGDVGSDRYHRALGYLRGESALVGDEHTATRAGAGQRHGYAAYFFTWQGVKLLEG